MAGESKGPFSDDKFGQSGSGVSGAGSTSGRTGSTSGSGTYASEESASDAYRQASRSAERMSAAAREEASELADALIRHVEERPLRALAMLVGIGFVAGWMVAR